MFAPRLTPNAVRVLKTRYLKKNPRGKVTETPQEMFMRVARHVAQADNLYRTGNNLKITGQTFYEMMARTEFLPNSPTLMNAGRELGQLAACFVIPVEDSLDSIFEAVKTTALIHQTGGGTGFSFSRLRPKDDPVAATGGGGSGAGSFFFGCLNRATGGQRRGGPR